MNAASIPAYDVLNIPQTMLTYKTVMNGISVGIFAFLFVLSILTENVKTISGKSPNYRKLIWRTILVICGLVLYRHIFIKTVALCEAIGMSFFSIEDFYAFKSILASQYDKIPTTIVSISVQNFIASLFVYAAITIESVILLFRYMLLSALYIIGPLAITLGLWTPTSSITKGWFTTLFQLSFWVITLRVLEATMLSLNANSILQNGGTAEYILISALVITLVAMTPLITERLISGANISLMGGIAMATFTTVTAKWGGHAAAGHKALFGKEGVITKTYSNIKDRVSSWRSSGKSTPKESEPEEQHRR